MKRTLSFILALVLLIGLMPQITHSVSAAQNCAEHSYVGGVCEICGSSVLGDEWIAPEFAEGDYSMVVIPDTQILVQYWPEAYYKQMQ